jgi:four helix bundle protein
VARLVQAGTRVVATRAPEHAVRQLTEQLQSNIEALTSTPMSARRHVDRRLRDTASAVVRQVGEGAARRNPVAFAQFLRLARGTVSDLLQQLRFGVVCRHWTADAVADAEALCHQTSAALTRLIVSIGAGPLR